MDEEGLRKATEIAREALRGGKSIGEVKKSIRQGGYSEEELNEIMAAAWEVPKKPVTPPEETKTGLPQMLQSWDTKKMAIVAVVVIAVIAVLLVQGPAPEGVGAPPEERVTPSVDRETILKERVERPVGPCSNNEFSTEMSGERVKLDYESRRKVSDLLREGSSIAGINDLTCLTNLDLSYGLSVDLSEIGGLVNLKALNLRGTHIESISNIKTFKNLEELDLCGTGITDLSLITGLSKLKALSTDCGADLTKIGGVKSLTSLKLCPSFFELVPSSETKYISDIGNLENLNSLEIPCEVTIDFSGVGSLISLERLSATASEVHNIYELGSIPDLDRVDLYIIEAPADGFESVCGDLELLLGSSRVDCLEGSA